MGRSIPSFRQHLLEIEKLKLSIIKRIPPTKNDRQTFDMVFDNGDCILLI